MKIFLNFIRGFSFIQRKYRVNSLNSGSVLNIKNGPPSGPSVCTAAKDRKEVHHCVERPISGIWYTSGI